MHCNSTCWSVGHFAASLWQTKRDLIALQDAQKLLAEVIWQADRLAAELAESDRAMARLASVSMSVTDTRNVADVDNDLEALENERAALEHNREQAMRKHERLK